MKILLLLGCGVFALHTLNAADSNIASSAVNHIGVELHRQMAADYPNLCLSPLSIQAALAMVYAGAAGETREEMAKALHYPTDEGSLEDSFGSLTQALNATREKSIAVSREGKSAGRGGDPINFNLANRLFGQSGAAFRAPFLATLKDRYHSPLETLNFSADAEAARHHINAWVEGETKKRIQDLIPAGAVSAGTRLVLVNALYFKAPWQYPFRGNATSPEPFHIAGKESAPVPTMTQRESFGYARHDGTTLLSLPYSSGELQFVILLPDNPTGLHNLETKLSAEQLAQCTKLPQTEIILHLPKFKVASASMPLSRPLKTLGMKSAFDDPTGSADFDKMAPRTPGNSFFVSDVFHKTFIAVDEEGTEAAAATAAIMMLPSAAMRHTEPPEVRVDRPFLFAIQDVASGACLFLGRVTDPR